ncbi:uncharacterized protein CIMG_13700 [Coccidioides immitis RS]|uniref:Uncharacterized protein n=1 Tax=Coccidioides immitis (strain RS) TaxID=246410 RepID=A0A0D8JX20_COCIM|nr:uncharacterized protein CIMG_13700 [Coccidioides immitis RS]KJF61486.1 hypothetical protein CIMG_13700 [Coccidioides immitis RS]
MAGYPHMTAFKTKRSKEDVFPWLGHESCCNAIELSSNLALGLEGQEATTVSFQPPVSGRISKSWSRSARSVSFTDINWLPIKTACKDSSPGKKSYDKCIFRVDSFTLATFFFLDLDRIVEYLWAKPSPLHVEWQFEFQY